MESLPANSIISLYEYFGDDEEFSIDYDLEDSFTDPDLLDRMDQPYSPIFHDLDFMDDDLNDEDDEWT